MEYNHSRTQNQSNKKSCTHILKFRNQIQKSSAKKQSETLEMIYYPSSFGDREKIHFFDVNVYIVCKCPDIKP